VTATTSLSISLLAAPGLHVAPPVAAQGFSYVNVAAALVLVAIAMALSWREALDLEKDLTVACLRAFVQLMAIGYVIHVIFTTKSILWVALVIVAMLVFAAFTSGRRAQRLSGSVTLMFVAIGGSTLVTLGLMLALGIIPATARYVIPIGGMIVGNSMNVASVTAVRLLDDARGKRAQIEAALALGASPRQSSQGLVRRAVRLAMLPVIDSTKTMGIVFLPGAMTGMILAGANPLDAVRLQVVVMFMLLAAVSLTATLIAALAPSRLFTPQQQLRRFEA
jgi:putative ABC transport system permease protein